MFRYIRRWMRQPVLAGLIGEETAPGPALESDEDIITAFRERGQAGYHACGTCRMGAIRRPCWMANSACGALEASRRPRVDHADDGFLQHQWPDHGRGVAGGRPDATGAQRVRVLERGLNA